MFSGKTALVTGSTSGIGLGIAEQFAKAGTNIILDGMGDAAEIESTRARLAAQCPAKVRFDGADMSQPEAIEACTCDLQTKQTLRRAVQCLGFGRLWTDDTIEVRLRF